MTTATHVSTSNNSGTGIGCLGLAFFISLVLCILKVAGVLELSWVLALAPLLIVLGLGGVALLVLLVILAVGAAVLAISDRRKR